MEDERRKVIHIGQPTERNCLPARTDGVEGGTFSAKSMDHREKSANPECRCNDLPFNDGSNLELPIPTNLKGQRWSARYLCLFTLGSSGFSYFGEVDNGRMDGYGRLMLGEEQYMEGKWKNNVLEELIACKLICDKVRQTVMLSKKQDDYLLTIYESHYIARVKVNAIEELVFSDSVDEVKRLFFTKLSILEVVVDGFEKKRDALLDKFTIRLSEAVSLDVDPTARVSNLVRLNFYLDKPSLELLDIIRDRNIPLDVRGAAVNLFDCENTSVTNTSMFSNNPPRVRLDLKKIVEKVHRKGVDIHRLMLEGKCPTAFFPIGLLSSVRSFPEWKIVYVTSDDMDVFSHLASLPCFEQYSGFFTDLVEKYRTAVDSIAETRPNPSAMAPIMSPLYGFLFKSFWETIVEIAEIKSKHSNETPGNDVKAVIYRDMLKKGESGEWKLQEHFKWPVDEVFDAQKQKLKMFTSSGNNLSLFYKALEVQYNTLFRMLTHFSPENYIGKRAFEYDFHVLGGEMSCWEKAKMALQGNVGLAKRLQAVPKQRLIWLYLLDQTLHVVFQGDPDSQKVLDPYSSLLEGQISLIEKSTADSHETFRTMTHSIVKFITSSAPVIQEARQKGGVDMEILAQQMWSFCTASQEMINDPSMFSNFRDLITEYNTFLNLRLSVNMEAASGHFSAQVNHIMQTFMHIIMTSLRKSIPTSTLVWYMRALNDFLDDFKTIDFLGMYYVKSTSFDPNVMDIVYNKLSGKNRSYRVLNIEKYVRVLGDQPVPRHHIIVVVSKLLECLAKSLGKHWQTVDGNLEATQLECTGLLLDAIRKSFMYLKEQPDYVDFNLFERESTEPFVCLIDNCKTLNDLKKRIAIVSDSYWYIRKMDEIGIDQALEMLKSANKSRVVDTEALRGCYTLYLSHYNECIATYRGALSEGKSHAEGVDTAKQLLGNVRLMHFSMWTEDFKKKEVPVMLAVVGAVWSLLVSKDVSSTGKFLKPHCIQILCILRLLSIESPEGLENHLAQVLTGQGKSVISGLLSSLLALTGHKVRVLCYSPYLSSRDQNYFSEFFKTFKVDEKITYQTFRHVAEGFLQPLMNGKEVSLHQLVKERVMDHKSWPATAHLTPVSKNTILLIDEVDVFFSDDFYGNGYTPLVALNFLALADIQRYIWELVQVEHSVDSVVIQCCMRIDSLAAYGDESMLELQAFIDTPGTYPLLSERADGYLNVKQYSNKDLFMEHLQDMADDAIEVRDADQASSGYELGTDGIIRCKDEEGVYSETFHDGYRNVFNYFRLKKSQYDHKNFVNYGNLILSIGEISYARLPSQFQLILGVSGTLARLGSYEKSGLKFYGIHNSSVLPSFFGESNLKFDKNFDLHFFLVEQEWLTAIFNRANAIVESRRAVLVFFETDDALKVFYAEYHTKFDRMNVITENTPDSQRDTYIDEAGLVGAVTLATRGMGRGVDYKSSLAVEKSGGVHVVQTFFSVDVKEETQIKGRTARKDNKGSYELVICREHLVRGKVIPEANRQVLSYQGLDRIRQRLTGKKGRTVNENIRKSEHNHKTTMQYFGLL